MEAEHSSWTSENTYTQDQWCTFFFKSRGHLKIISDTVKNVVVTASCCYDLYTPVLDGLKRSRSLFHVRNFITFVQMIPPVHLILGTDVQRTLLVLYRIITFGSFHPSVYVYVTKVFPLALPTRFSRHFSFSPCMLLAPPTLSSSIWSRK